MSHAVGDGLTYYEIFKQLQPGAAVRELATARVQSFSESLRDMSGRAELEWADSLPAQLMSTFAMMPCCGGGGGAECCAFYLDTERLAAAKAAAAADGGVPYVSTNDILTSATSAARA